ncbi:uncharacterized protein LOC128876891 [Hylaeus volcanicus]|uniref:uncharacterized protein LOC128876891 n=1 Tax=Hylaeus volcanicus TaxID=313075 RepID=UPI0023B873B0|nr:uncharacterized protein LOC128876891 [Hylaeus volcanicus]XP_053979681.1 uncharacterized protein LOC128876891 [Hylaeus volcanicus]
MSFNVEQRLEDEESEEKSNQSVEVEEEEEEEEGQSRGQKLWKTLDVPLTDVDTDDNLYLAVRQCLHKVNRVSKSSLPQKSPRRQLDRGGVSEETSVGRFHEIKALFDLDSAKEKRRTMFGCRQTTIERLNRTLKQDKM